MKTPDQIKKALEYCRGTYCDSDCPYFDECKIGNDTVITDYKGYVQLLESQVPRWIPVTERLPEQYEAVLIAYDDDLGGKGVSMGIYFDGKLGAWSGVILPDDITHWMPLPSAPEEVDQNG